MRLKSLEFPQDYSVFLTLMHFCIPALPSPDGRESTIQKTFSSWKIGIKP